MAGAAANHAVFGGIALAANLFAAAAVADQTPATGAAAPAQVRAASTAAFEDFVREVGIDMAAIPVELRRQWASAPRVTVSDCAFDGDHADHGHGAEPDEQAAGHRGAVEYRAGE